jgi:CubicO group peptidase (beta-lactamase class C family)
MTRSRALPAAAVALALLAVPARAEAPGVTAAAVDMAVAALDAAAEEQIARDAVPGMAIAVVFRDSTIFAKGYGVRDVRGGAPVDADTVFQLASVSKPIGATVVAALVGEGVVDWDSRISDLDPSFEMFAPWVTREVTIRDLYAHRSGLPEHAGDLLEDLGYDRGEVLRRLRFQPPATSFRSGYAYTNFGLTEAAVAAAMAAGVDWEELSEQKLYGPLGMTSTSSRHADFVARPNRALNHVLVDGEWEQKYDRQPDAQTPAGGVSSSVDDMAKWLRLQLAGGKFEGRQLVGAEALAETHLPQMMTNPTSLSGIPQFYGLGWNVGWTDDGRLRLSHSGAFSLGAATTVNLSPADGLGVVILTNAAPTGVAEGLAANFMDTALYGAPTRDWLDLYGGIFRQMAREGVDTAYAKPPVSPTTAAPDEAYLGTYANDFFGEIGIVAADGGLAIVQGPQTTTAALTHYDRDIFTYVPAGESAEGVSGVIFTLGPNGRATAVRVENLDVDGVGTFERK